MDTRHTVARVSLPLIVVFVLTLLAFLPLAIPGKRTALQPVQGYTNPVHHARQVAPQPAEAGTR